jgi:hypothetical protein
LVGQRSDRVARKRSPEEKRAQLQALKQRLAMMKSHESPALRASIERNIAELEKDLSGAGAPKGGRR